MTSTVDVNKILLTELLEIIAEEGNHVAVERAARWAYP